MGRRVRREVPLHARTRSVDAWHRSGHWMTTRRRDRVRVWPWKTASRPMHSSHIAWPQTSVTVVGSKQMDILRTGAAVVFVEVFYLGVVEHGRVAHLVKARRRRAAVLFPWCGITC